MVIGFSNHFAPLAYTLHGEACACYAGCLTDYFMYIKENIILISLYLIVTNTCTKMMKTYLIITNGSKWQHSSSFVLPNNINSFKEWLSLVH